MTSEETPLLSDVPPGINHELVYQRFSPGYKKLLVVIVALCGFMPYFIAGSFLPSIPQIAQDLDTTGQNVSFAVSLSLFASSFVGLAAASYSTFYGRRPVYLIGLPFSIIGSFGASAAQNMPQLLFWRFWQCAGASPGMAVGGGVIGDIYKLEERGTALGFYLAGTLVGPAFAAPVGGFVTHYASWRAMQQCLGILSLLIFVVMFLAFPETSHPGTRGVDKRRESGYIERNRLPVFKNPLQPFNLLWSPNIFCVVTAGFLFLLTDYVLLLPLAYTIGKRYHIDNEALVGICFLPSGLGNMVGAPTAGRIADRTIIRWRKKRGGVWYPEDRLRASIWGGLFLAPLSVLGCGLIAHYIEGRTGLILCLIMLFLNGFGVDMSLNPGTAYLVDIMHSRSAEVMACNRGFRWIVMAFASTGIMPMIESYGFLATTIMSAVLAWVGYGLYVVTMRYGDRMRAWNDIGYSTAENN